MVVAKPVAALICVALAAAVLVGCTGSASSPSAPTLGPSGGAATPSGDRDQLAADIHSGWDRLISERSLPYTVTQVEFHDINAALAKTMGAPSGAWLVIQIDDPMASINSGIPARELLVDEPLKLYRDALRPYAGNLRFVAYYILNYRDKKETTIGITPGVLAKYQAGSLTDAQLQKAVQVSILKPELQSPGP
jgi:hypothetical protein